MNNIRTFLTFQNGNAIPALDLYREIFEDFELLEVDYYGPDEHGPEGTIIQAQFQIAGTIFGCADSPITHEWGFTPAISIWIDCRTVADLEHYFHALSEEGEVLMPLDNYGFSSRFGWVKDPYNVTWQLNQP